MLLGATGTGKSATTAWVIEQVQRPTLVMAPNKTLAAQLANEFRELLPNNAVEYFVSYYDYYQPEAYIPQTDTYIEKDSSINDEVERLRHSATSSLLTRRDVVVVASVSCIYGLGTPQEYVDRMVRLRVGEQMDRDQLLLKFVQMQYTRNDLAFTRGTFRVRGDTVEIIPVYEELAIRIELFGDEVERIYTLHPVTGEVVREETEMYVFPATHYVAGPERMERAIRGIEIELADRLAELERQGKLLEAQRLRMRTTYDIEMMRQVGSCSGIENYSRHIDGRSAGSAPNCLIDYFPDDFLLVIDESHQTVPQIGAMYEGDMSRKRMLVDHGFRLPSAMDNRPLMWEEFLDRIGQTLYLSATPGPYELAKAATSGRRRADHPADRPGRPGDRAQADQGPDRRPHPRDHAAHRAQRADPRHDADQEDGRGPHRLPARQGDPGPLPPLRHRHPAPGGAAAGAADRRVRRPRRHQPAPRGPRPARGVAGVHPRRRQGGVPALGAVAHPDHRSRRPQRQRAGAHVCRQHHPVDAEALDETSRRREKQIAFNKERGVDPQPLRKKIADITDLLAREDADTEQLLGSGRSQSRGRATGGGGGRGALAVDVNVSGGGRLESMAAADLASLIQELTTQMHAAAADLHFELAARLRDELGDLKKELRQMSAATQ